MNNILEDDDRSTGILGSIKLQIRRIGQAVNDARERYAFRQELANCEELDVILADLGLTRGELEPLLKCHPESGKLLRKMLARVGLDEVSRGDLRTRRELERVCTFCKSRGRCRTWLRSGGSEGYAEFCPNAELLDALRAHLREKA